MHLGLIEPVWGFEPEKWTSGFEQSAQPIETREARPAGVSRHGGESIPLSPPPLSRCIPDFRVAPPSAHTISVMSGDNDPPSFTHQASP